MAFDVGSIIGSIKLDYDSKGLKTFDRDMDRAGKSMGQLDKKSGRLSSSLKTGLKVGVLAAGSALGVGFVAGAKKSISAASDLDESLNKAKATFEGSSKSVIKWSKTSAKSIGLSQSAALEGAASIGAMLKPMGVAPGMASKMSMTMANLAADMASFNNQDPTEMLDKIRAGLSGESEPLKQFGTVLSETRVKAYAVAEGMIKHNEELTEGQKITARYGLMLKDTVDQQGDFEKTSKGLANQQRIFNAQIEDLSAVFGTMLLPYVTKFANFLTEKVVPAVRRFVVQFQNGKGEGGKLKDTLQGLWTIIKNLWPTIESIGKSIGKLIGWFSNLSPEVQKTALSIGTLLIVGTKFVKFLRLAPMMAGPWGIALTALAIAAVAIIQNWDKIKPFFSKLFNWLKGTFNSVADKVKSAAKSGFLGPAAWIIANWGKVKTFFRDLPGKIGSFLSGIGSTLISPFKSAFNTVRDIFNRMIRFIRGAIGKIKGAVSDVGGFIGDGLGALGGVVGLADGGVVGPGAGGPQLFLAGEGGAKEYVISTEGPRNKNVGYLKEAASALGIPMFAQGGKVQDRINQRISNLQTKMDLKRRDFELTGGRVTSKEYDRLIGINQMIESSIKDLISVTKGQARRDARFALKSAQLDRRDLVKARNTATGEGSTATGDLDFQIQGLETQLQLAEGGYGGDAGALRTKIKSKLQKKLKTLRDRLSGTSNREQIMMLNDAIQGTLGQLSSYSSGESGASMIEQTAAASQLRYSALAQFGGNAFQSRLGSSIASSGQTVVNLNGEFKLDSNDPHGSVRELGYQIATNLN